MKCINEEYIQKYIDKEVTLQEITSIEKHISSCKSCSSKIKQQRKLSYAIRKMINTRAEEYNKEIPLFRDKNNEVAKKFITINRFIMIMAAASILLFIIVFSHKMQKQQDEVIFLEIGFASDYDANRTISQQELIFNIIDEEGKIQELFYLLE
jgi:CHASE3 domain sensor protein